MMTQAFYTGISGIKTNSTAIDVVSDNLANINTVGYRGYDVEFASIFQKSVAASSSTDTGVGVGVQAQATGAMQSTGSLLLTDRSTDLAINGDGWFGIQAEGDPVYTRNGNFTFNENDDLVSSEGYHVLGTMGNNISADDVLTQKLDTVGLGEVANQTQLRFPQALTYPPVPSSNATFQGNVGVGLEDSVVMGAGVIDAQSNKNNLQLTFTKDDTEGASGSQWSVVATTQSLDGETIYDTQEGIVTFDETGALLSSTLTTIDNNGSEVAIDLGSGYSGIVSINTPVVPGSSSADGTIGGELTGYTVNPNAEVIATFTNGEQSSVGKIALYHFQNDQGLDRISGTTFQESSNSGNPIFYQDESGENITGSSVTNFKLEGSNYNMSTGLTQLIIFQRAYDANSKSITTADEMMQKALNMDA